MIHKLIAVQKELKAPKSQYNSFGGYSYRNCEDILEAVKPLLAQQGLALYISDTVKEIGGRVYVEARVTITDGEKEISVTASAREEETKKGMDSSQITGSTSSYARKYALNALFCIDDNKDADFKKEMKIDAKKLVCCECKKPFKPQETADGVATAEYQFINAILHRGGAYCKACYDKRKAEANGRTES